MDLSSFCDDNFDVKDWMNKTFKLPEAQENRDVFTSSLVMKLQLFIQKVNGALQDTSQQVVQSLPRVVRDVESLQQEASLLREKMNSVRQEITKVEKDTASSMETLIGMDCVKSRMQDTGRALQEADNWTTLANDVDEVFETGDLELIVSRLVGMQHSLEILTHIPDYEERQLTLEGHKNHLEALASPEIVQTFNSHAVDKARFYCSIFRSIDRLPQLLKYYHKCEREALLHKWVCIVETEQVEGVQQWINTLYDHIDFNCHEQIRWCRQVFGDFPCVTLLVELYTDVLKNLDPSLLFCIDAGLKQQTDALHFITELKQATKHFVTSMDNTLKNGNYDVPFNVLVDFAHAAYSPYIPRVVKYGYYEEQIFSKYLTSTRLLKEDLSDSIHELAKSVLKTQVLINDAERRCATFTESVGIEYLSNAIKSFIESYVENYKSVLDQLEQQKATREDWALFQLCLTLIQTVGDLLVHLKQLDKTLTYNAIKISNQYSNIDQMDPFLQYDQLLLDRNGRKLFKIFLTKFQDGDYTFLEWSISRVVKLCGDVMHVSFNVVFSPISCQLNQLVTMEIWGQRSVSLTSDLPAFSYSPQEYITQIGQYIMMLPQHLEPFVLQDNPALTEAFLCADLPYESNHWDVSEKNPADALLSAIAIGTCQHYAENILKISELGSGAVKQLATDIDYLDNVLDDLGLPLSENLQNINKLLKLTTDEYWTSSRGLPPRIVAAIRQMRNITPKV